MTQRTRSGNISLGEVINHLHYITNGGVSDWYTNRDIEIAKSTLYHINKLRKIIRGFHERMKK